MIVPRHEALFDHLPRFPVRIALVKLTWARACAKACPQTFGVADVVT